MAKMERVECPECGREVSAYVPAGGDGSALRPVNHLHDDPPGAWCPGRYSLVDAREAFPEGTLTNVE